jgi:hypothetical protein
VTFKPSRQLKKIILNGNKVLQAKKKLIVLQNWNLGHFCNNRALKLEVHLWKMAASSKEVFI